ncbi:heme ABC transporter ATP-binding protein [Lysinibacillus telephonicus]|uniref:heme ABC transporter ATP-binding protein n=1 Tax=Lysinibacillus telephonicus TaxID=1714840 RepID=UPI0031FC4901
MTKNLYEINSLNYSLQEKQILNNIQLVLPEGEFIGLIGPNGSGKSTLLKLLYRYIKPQNGQVWLREKDVWEIGEKQFAKEVAVVTQESSVAFDFTVKELVFMGRTPHKKLLKRDSKSDEEIVEDAMKKADVLHLANRNYSSLSGGEKKRVIVARALAQQTDVLILDEPTNHLDIEHQFALLDLLSECSMTVIMAIHDLNLAATYCDKLLLLQKGKLCAFGSPEEVLTVEQLKHVFNVDVEIMTNPFTNKPYLQFVSKKYKEKGKVNES